MQRSRSELDGMTKLDGRIAVITGASSGVGRAIAEAFGREGARVALIARGIDGLEASASAVRAAGAEAIVLPLDVADASAVEAAAARVVREWGGLDIWVNNAMVSVGATPGRGDPKSPHVEDAVVRTNWGDRRGRHDANRDRAKVYGVALHLVNGWMFSLVYVAAFHVTHVFAWWFGVAIGLVHGAFVLAVAMPVMPGMHPRMASDIQGPTVVRQLEPPGFLARNYGRRTPLSVLVAHLVFGFILGFLYSPS